MARRRKALCPSLEAIQGNLLTEGSGKIEIAVKPILQGISLRPGLVKVYIEQTTPAGYKTAWPLPIQWTPSEAAAVVEGLHEMEWDLLDGEGAPIQKQRIWGLCEIIANSSGETTGAVSLLEIAIHDESLDMG